MAAEILRDKLREKNLSKEELNEFFEYIEDKVFLASATY